MLLKNFNISLQVFLKMKIEGKKHLSHTDIKSSNLKIDREKWIILIKLFQNLHYAKLRKTEVIKSEFLIKNSKHKKIANKVWECFYDLKIEWPYEIYFRIYDVD